MSRRRGSNKGILGLIGLIVIAALFGGGAKAVPAIAHAVGIARGGIAGYVNPLAGGSWNLYRTDQGVDYVPLATDAVRAIGDGTVIFSSTSTGWPGGGFISYRLSGGKAAGAVIYVAEGIYDLVAVGTVVHAGQRIGKATADYGTEWGWAACSGDFPVVQYNGAPDGTPMPGGLAFARFMRELGAGSRDNPGPGPDVMRC